MAKYFGRTAAALSLAVLMASSAAAQTNATELNIAPPAQFDSARAHGFEVTGQTRLRYAVIPETLSLSEDGIVRYVMVVTSTSGASNVVFDALRCTTDESKTLARWSPSRQTWVVNSRAEWADVNDLKNRAAQVLARGIFCQGNLTLGSRQAMLDELQRQ